MTDQDNALVLSPEEVFDVRYMATAEPDVIRLVVSTTRALNYSYLIINNVKYPAYTNLDVPYPAGSHGFLVPKSEILAHPDCTLYATALEHNRRPKGPSTFCCVSFKFDPESEISYSEAFELENSRYEEICSTDTTITDGLTYTRISCVDKDNAPGEFFVLRADTKKIGIDVALAGDGRRFEQKILDANGNEIGTKTMYPVAQVEEMAKQAIAKGLDVRAATNADFFDMWDDNMPFGLSVNNGEILARPDSKRPFFGVLKDGSLVISSFAENPEYKESLDFAVGGSHIMIKNGEINDVGLPESFSHTRHPRTAVGFCDDGSFIILVVDGRKPEYSNGASLVDLALMFKKLGASYAINLDGGGSSIVLVCPDGESEFSRKNLPVDADRPTEHLLRPVYNGILLYKK